MPPLAPTKPQGLGLGLSVHASIAKAHDGVIVLTDREDSESGNAGSISDSDFVVFLVDDDQMFLKAMTRLLEPKGFKVQSFSSASKFLVEHDPTVSGCAIFDVSMPGLDGLELQAKLAEGGVDRPIIFLTGVAEIPDSVKAIKAGAIDFLTKPVKSRTLLAAIELARSKGERARKLKSQLETNNSRLAKLTPREREVLKGVVAGKLNKQIAGQLGVAIKTIKMHRGRMMRKMGVRSVADLVRITEQAAR